MAETEKLQGRVALVTGASRGIGKAIALALGKAGCNVIVNYAKEHDAAKEVVKAIRAMGRVGLACHADVSIVTDVEHLVGEAESTFGMVDILVNNAGIAESKAGLIGLTHSYASLLAKEGITVNAIAPALIETEMVTTNPNASTDRLPMGLFGAPEEIARVAVVLAESDFITGQTISVNGGWYMT
jgi:3-oxoacyl-[acyl-carrier protein] reductase